MKKITVLELKRKPSYYATLPPDLREEVEIIKQILSRHNYEASRETIALAWHEMSQDSLCVSWRDVLSETEKDILNNIMEYVEPRTIYQYNK